MDEEKEGKRANLLNLKKTQYHHNIPRKKGEKEKALVTKEMALSNLGKNTFIGDSAATSHMTMLIIQASLVNSPDLEMPFSQLLSMHARQA